MIYIIWILAILVAITLYLKQVYSKFKRRGVKNPPVVPVFGNMFRVFLRLDNFTNIVNKIYHLFPEERFIGFYQFLQPVLMVRDLELVKKITIKDFEYFVDHQSFVDQEVDPMFGRILTALKGQEWKDMRSNLSPAFTSSKIRLMVPFMVDVGEQMIKSIKKKTENSGVKYIDLEGKDIATRYTNDVIASCAFGLKVDSHTDEDNEFYKMGKSITNSSFKDIIKAMVLIMFPTISKKLKLSFLNAKSKKFFRDLVLETMKDREARNIYRPDMIQLLIDAKKGTLTHDDKTSGDADAGFATATESDVGKKVVNRVWTDDDLTAQGVLFFIAGFETVAMAMAFTLYELAVNPDVQEKLVQEIRENELRNGGKFDYNCIQNMGYMDMVISEVLRMWSPAVVTDRLCVKDYNMGKLSETATEDYVLRKGELIHIPIWAFHRDPNYFPNPNKFDPERFSEENKRNIKPFSYMPFGLGPRNCIASRFALCELKVMIYQLLQHMEISPCEKTVIPPVLSTNFSIALEGGYWLRFKSRN